MRTGIFDYYGEAHSPPLTTEEIALLKTMKKKLILEETKISAYFLNKMLAGGRAPMSIYEKLMIYLNQVKSDANLRTS